MKFTRNTFAHTLIMMAATYTFHITPSQAAEPLPTLEVVFDCGDCQPNEKIKALIAGAYMDAADKQHRTLDEAIPAIPLRVTSYRSRGKARFFVGILAGADRIVGSVNCQGKSYEVSDIAISAINGIESVAENIGLLAYRKVESCYADTAGKAPASTPSQPSEANPPNQEPVSLNNTPQGSTTEEPSHE